MNKNIKILPILFFPPIEFFYHILNSDQIIFELKESYPKQTYRNRCTIYSANGLFDLSIPVNKPNGNHTLTKDIIISFQEDWKSKFWRSIEAAYNSSPYFLFYKDDIKTAFAKQEDHLFIFNLALLKIICKILSIELDFGFSEEYHKNYTEGFDLRNSFNPKIRSTELHYPEYIQVFSGKFGFKENLSILDLLFNLGPEASLYLRECRVQSPEERI